MKAKECMLKILEQIERKSGIKSSLKVNSFKDLNLRIYNGLVWNFKGKLMGNSQGVLH